MSLRTIAIDWSGAARRPERKIWLAEVMSGQVARLESGRSRYEIASHLVEIASTDSDLVVGLDFAFSFPRWFFSHTGLGDAPSLWRLAEEEGESWLGACPFPFWGRPGRPRPELEEHFRCTERTAPGISGIRPKSVFQIGGAGAVGTGSVRGLPILRLLRDAGFTVWPFDTPRFPLVIEIYPRLLTGPVVKGDQENRSRYLQDRYPMLPPSIQVKAAESEDAFDALVSALVMAHHDECFSKLARSWPDSSLEGEIWIPPP